MKTYTEDEIRKAWDRAKGNYGCKDLGLFLSELKKADREHDFADTDTVTVKEVRDAARRVFVLPGRNLGADLLKDISIHREPEYPCGTVWSDANGVIWLRTTDRKWLRFNSLSIYDDDIPHRPLTEMR